MAKIDTNLKLDTSIKSFNETGAVSVSRKTAQRNIGADNLAKALKDISPVFGEYVIQKEKEKATEKTIEGANAINGLTLSEARELHKAGFPDINNDWARYGAYKQYAANASDNFVFEFQKEYENNKHSKEWNWEEALATKTNTFLNNKKNDVYFETAFNTANATIRKWVNGEELKKQSKLLTERVEKDTAYQIKTIPDRVSTRLQVDFFENYNGADDYDTGQFQLEQNKFYLDNFSKYWDEELDIIKTNLNPALTLSDLDGLVIEAAKTHLATDGRFAAFYKKMLTEERPDGTPAIIDNPKWNDAASKILADIQTLDALNNFEADFFSGKTHNYDNKDYNKNSSELLKQKIKIIKNNNPGINDNEAFEKAIDLMLPAIRANAPIPYLKDILARPIGREITEDNRLAFSIALKLHKEGLLGTYFNKDNKMSVFWSIAVNKLKSGNQSPDSILKELGQYSNNFRTYTQLISEDKKEFINDFSNLDMLKPQNKQIIYTMGEYFKNVVGSEWKSALKSWVSENYEEYNEVLYNKNELQELGIGAGQYEMSKQVIAELIIEKLKLTPNIIDHDLDDEFLFGLSHKVFISNPEQVAFGGGKVEKDKINPDDYQLIINTEDGELSLGVVVGDVEYQVPATYTTNDGTVAWLTVPKAEFHKKMNEIALKQKTEADAKAKKKDKKIQRINKNLRKQKSYYLD